MPHEPPVDPKVARAAELDKAIRDADAKKKSDAEESAATLNKVLAKLDDCLGRMDQINSRMDKYDDDAKRAKDDAAKKRGDTKRKKDDEQVESPMSSERDDDGDTGEGFAEQPTQGENMAKPTVADARADAAKYINDLADCQEKAEVACQAWGLKAPAPLADEDVLRYRKRLLRPHQNTLISFEILISTTCRAAR